MPKKLAVAEDFGLTEDLLVKRFDDTESANARRFYEQHHRDVRYATDRGVWSNWNGKYWDLDDVGGVMRRMNDVGLSVYQEAANEPDEKKRKLLWVWASKSDSRRNQENSLALARWKKGIEVREFSKVFDRQPLLLNVKNGTIDLKTGKLLPHNREHFLTKMVPIDYEEKDLAECCPEFKNFLHTTLKEDENLVFYMIQFMGLCLTGLNWEQSWWMFHGLTASGKSTFLNVLRGMLGPYAVVLPDNYFLLKNNNSTDYATAKLAGARLATSAETPEGKTLDVSKVKSLTGGEPITGEYKYENCFEFTPEAKLVLATNHRPKIRESDDAIWRRIKVVPFLHTVPLEDRNPNLAEELLEKAPEILRLAVGGCLHFLTQKRLVEPGAMNVAVSEYRKAEDVIQDFTDECCVLSQGLNLLRKELFDLYVKWCKENNQRQASKKKLAIELARLGVKAAPDDHSWNGIGLKA